MGAIAGSLAFWLHRPRLASGGCSLAMLTTIGDFFVPPLSARFERFERALTRALPVPSGAPFGTPERMSNRRASG